MWDADGGLNFHCIAFCFKCSSICDLFQPSIICFSSFCPATKFVPLSDMISFGFPRRLMNLCSALIKKFVSSEYDTSICIALTAKHVNKHPYLSTVLLPRLMVQNSLIQHL